MNVNIQRAIEQAAQKLIEFEAREVYVFGSAAQGILHEGSDIDLAVTGLPPDKFFYAMGGRRYSWSLA